MKFHERVATAVICFACSWVLTSARLDAAVNDIPGNLVPNGEFDTGIEGWTLVWGDSMIFAATHGNTAAGSLVGNSKYEMPNMYSYEVDSACFDVGAAASFSFGGYVYPFDSGVQCVIRVYEYDAFSCGGSMSQTSTSVNQVPDSVWSQVSSSLTTQGSTVSARIHLYCDSWFSSDFFVYLDDVFFVPSLSDSIFADNFETGNTSAWSDEGK